MSTSRDSSSVMLCAGIQRGSAEAAVVHIGTVRDKNMSRKQRCGKVFFGRNILRLLARVVLRLLLRTWVFCVENCV